MFSQKNEVIATFRAVISGQLKEVNRLESALIKSEKENAELVKNFEASSKNFNAVLRDRDRLHMQRDWLAKVSEQKSEVITNLKVELELLKIAKKESDKVVSEESKPTEKSDK
jgi:small-conductance mechanosensitive channel